MTIDKDRLKALAEAATKLVVDWRVMKDRNNVNIVIGDGGWTIFSAWHTPDGKALANAEFAAAANPNTVLALLAENEILERRNAILSEVGCEYCGGSGWVTRIDGECLGVCDNCPSYELNCAKHALQEHQRAVMVAAEFLATITSSDGSGHADLARSVLRIAGIPDSEATAMVDQWKSGRAWGNKKWESK